MTAWDVICIWLGLFGALFGAAAVQEVMFAVSLMEAAEAMHPREGGDL